MRPRRSSRNTLFRGFDDFFWGLSAWFAHSPESLCELETPDGADRTLALGSGDLVTALDLSGSLTLRDGPAIRDLSDILAETFAASFRRKGHTLQFVFSRDPEGGREEVLRATAPLRATAVRMNLSLSDYFSSLEDALSRYVAQETATLVIGTRHSLLNRAERREEKKRPRNAPGGSGSQRLDAGLPLLRARHRSLVASLLRAFSDAGLAAREMTPAEVLARIRHAYAPEFTHPDWTPRLPGDGSFPLRAPDPGQSRKDYSHILWPSIGSQVFPVGAEREKWWNLQTLRIGNRLHAPLRLTLPPETPAPFGRLFNSLVASRLPWRASFLLSGDGLSRQGVKALFASFLGWTCADNKLVTAALTDLRALEQSGKAIVGFQAVFDTWAPMDDPALLARRKAELAQAIQGWGNCDVSDQCGDPLLGVLASLPAVTRSFPAQASAPPLSEALFMMPLARPALPWREGSWLLRTPDGKLTPYQPGSNLQAAWVEIGVAPMGGGKSVALNAANLALCLLAGRDTLPWIMTVDVGPSSSGLVSLLKSALPDTPEAQRLAAYHRLQNTKEYAINPFGLPLGCTAPLPLHRTFLQNLLVLLGTPLGSSPPDGVAGLAGLVIDRVYEDLGPSGPRAKRYEKDLVPEVDAALIGIAFAGDARTTWHEVRDALFGAGRIPEADRAQRLAEPTLEDAAGLVLTPAIADLYRPGTTRDIEDLPSYFWRILVEAINQYPILAHPTVFDIGDARIVSLDLDEVTQESGPLADRQAAVMYMLARHVLTGRLFLMPDHVPLIPERYRAYHAARIAGIRRDPKKLNFDEFHRVSKNPALVAQIVRDIETAVRESRKWNLHVGLYSQQFEDFPDALLEQATSFLIFGAGTPQSVDKISERFGLSEPVARALSRMTGPTEEGANLIACFRTKEGFVQQLLTNTLGPVALWAFSTTAEDAAIRDALYRALGPREARRRLALRFPGGSAKKEVERRRADRDGDSDRDAILSVLQDLLSPERTPS